MPNPNQNEKNEGTLPCMCPKLAEEHVQAMNDAFQTGYRTGFGDGLDTAASRADAVYDGYDAPCCESCGDDDGEDDEPFILLDGDDVMFMTGILMSAGAVLGLAAAKIFRHFRR